MDEGLPDAQGSPPLPKKGSYNFDFDNLDEFSNPFESKTKMKMGSSPPIQPASTFDFDENADPFKSKKSLANSPPVSPKAISQSANDVVTDVSNYTDDDRQTQAPDMLPENTSSAGEEKISQVTPKKKKVIKKPQVQSKFKPPKNLKRNKNSGGDIEILMPGLECENNNGTTSSLGNTIDDGVSPSESSVDDLQPAGPVDGVGVHSGFLNNVTEDGPPPLDAAPEAMAMSTTDIDRHFIDKDDDDHFANGAEFKDARDWTSSNMNTNDDTESTVERGNTAIVSPKTEGESSHKTEDEVVFPSGPDPLLEKHPAARALQAAQSEASVSSVSSGKYESSSEEGPYYDAIDYAFPPTQALGSIGNPQMSGTEKKADMEPNDNKGTVVTLVQVLRYSQTDWNKMKQELELNFQTTLLNKERDWSRLLADRDKKISSLEESNKKLKATKEDMRAVVTEFEKTMAQLQAEKDKMKNESGKKVHDLEGERDQALEDLSSVENAFSDLHRRYEKSKTVIEGFKRNEEELKECMEDLKMKLKKSESKLGALRSQAEEKLDKANEDIDKIKKSTKGEVARLEAALKKSELRISSLDEALTRKEKENQELTAICDELIAKVGS